MKTKETLATKLIKRFYGVQGVLDEYRRQELYKIGNTGFMVMFYYALISNFIVLFVFSLDNYKHTEDILMWYISANMIFLICGICGFIIFTTKQKHLIENEVEIKDIKSQKRRLIYGSIRQGIFFGIVTFILDGMMSPHFSDLTSRHSIWDHIIEGTFFGVGMYFFQRINLKKVQ